MFKLLKNQRGFTLVELMVVVAIIAILSTIAIPNFRKFQAKAKTSEAKLHLSSIYSAEVAFLSDSDVYATCLKQMGYDPEPQASQRYYTTGFNSGLTNDHITGTDYNGVECDGSANDEGEDGQGIFVALKTTGGKDPIAADELDNTYMSTTGDAFRASAQGWISPSFIKAEGGFLNKALDAVVSKAHALNTGEEPLGVSCSNHAPAGSSLFSINDEKNLSGICKGY